LVDGLLDLYIANYRTSTIGIDRARLRSKTVDGQPEVVAFGGRPLTEPTSRIVLRSVQTGADGGGSVLHDELGEADVLYRT